MTAIKAEYIYREVEKRLTFGFCKAQIYMKADRYWKRLSEDEAVLQICRTFDQRLIAEISDTEVREALKRMRNTPNFQIEFIEGQKESLVNVANGVFDADQGNLVDEMEGWNFSYVLDFEYQKRSDIKDAPTFQNFLKTSFSDDYEEKSRLLLEIIGYCLSDYTKAKTAFFFIGESNSGKSTMLELMKRVLPERTVTAIPLQRLNNRFNIARLYGTRLNICTELAENSFSALDTFKQMTANEIVTAEHKGKAPFEFRIRCKSVNAGNMIPRLERLEGMDAVLNRMTILMFRQSISNNKQDKRLLEKLWEERNVIFSLSLDALSELKKDDFWFIEPKDSKELKRQLRSQSHVFEDFLREKCVLEKTARVHFVDLYEAFQRYCGDNLLDIKMTRSQFSQRFCKVPGVERKKVRVNGSKPLWGVEGLRLKNIFEDDKDQDSEVSDIHGGREENNITESAKAWNIGTLERRQAE